MLRGAALLFSLTQAERTSRGRFSTVTQITPFEPRKPTRFLIEKLAEWILSDVFSLSFLPSLPASWHTFFQFISSMASNGGSVGESRREKRRMERERKCVSASKGRLWRRGGIHWLFRVLFWWCLSVLWTQRCTTAAAVYLAHFSLYCSRPLFPHQHAVTTPSLSDCLFLSPVFYFVRHTSRRQLAGRDVL